MEARKQEIEQLAYNLNIKPRVNWYRYQAIYNYAKSYLTQLTFEEDPNRRLELINKLDSLLSDYRDKKLPRATEIKETRESIQNDIKTLCYDYNIKCPGLTHHNLEQLKKIRDRIKSQI
jgi:hypothetical protein